MEDMKIKVPYIHLLKNPKIIRKMMERTPVEFMYAIVAAAVPNELIESRTRLSMRSARYPKIG